MTTTTGPWKPRVFGGKGAVLGLCLTTIVVLAAVLAPIIATADPFAVEGPSLAPPSRAYPMGTDALGRDLWSGIAYGARTSVLVGVSVAAIAMWIGIGVGMWSGYRGGLIDDLLMRVTEWFQALPRFFLAVVVLAQFGPGVDRLVLVLGLTSWPLIACVVRAQVLSVKEQDFVVYAQATGATVGRILSRHVLPHTLASATTLVGLVIGQVILLEASLGFLGLGDPNAMSWGYLASEAQPFLRVAWWLPVFPGLAIMTAVLGFNLLGDALTNALDARHQTHLKGRPPA